ncbi:MAG: transglutaminase domain-containing protein [Clostridium sp.]|nr:transglutaminase domain-containing protein [Clostridium sp.]
MKIIKNISIIIIAAVVVCGVYFKDEISNKYRSALGYVYSTIYSKNNSNVLIGKKESSEVAEKNKEKPLNNVSVKENKSVNSDDQAENALTHYDYTVNNYNDYYNCVKDALENFKNTITVKLNNYNTDTYNLNVVNNVLDDYYDIDYGVSGASGNIYSEGNVHVMKINFQYKLSKVQMTHMRNEAKERASEIISSIIRPNMSEISKEIAIHDYIVNNTVYDYSNYVSGTIPEESFTDYGVLVKGRAVCEGYAKAMFRLLNMVGVKCITIKGTAQGQSHAWNIVDIDGNYTQVDATFDDPVTTDGHSVLSHKYFDISDSQMQKDHKWDSSKYPKCVTINLKRN